MEKRIGWLAGRVWFMAWLGLIWLLLARPVWAIEELALKQLLSELNRVNLEGSQLQVLEKSIVNRQFTAADIVRILEVFNFTTGKIRAVELLAPNLEDFESKPLIINAFIFVSDQIRIKTLLDQQEALAKLAETHAPVSPFEVKISGTWPDDEFQKLLTEFNQNRFVSERQAILKLAVWGNPRCLTDVQIGQLIGQKRDAPEMISILQILDGHSVGISCAGAARILRLLPRNTDRLELFRAMKDMLVDLDQRAALLPAFDFSSDQASVRKILRKSRPLSLLYGRLTGRNILFLTDASQGMLAPWQLRGKPSSRWAYLQRELAKALQDPFDPSIGINLVLFGQNTTAWKNDFQPATPENRQQLLEFLAQQTPAGPRNMGDAIDRVMKMDGIATIALVSGGQPGVGDAKERARLLEKVQKWRRNSSIVIQATALMATSETAENKRQLRDFCLKLATMTKGVFRALE